MIDKLRSFFKRYYGVLLSLLMASYFLMITSDHNKIGIYSFISTLIIISVFIFIDVKGRKINKDKESYSHEFFIDFGFTIVISDVYTFFSFTKIENIEININLWAYGSILIIGLICIFSGYIKKIEYKN